MNKRYLPSLIIIIIQIIFSIVMFANLSDDVQIPVHWNAKGEIDGYYGKTAGLFMFPGFNIIILLIMLAMPIISVRYKNNPHRYAKILTIISNVLVLFFALIHTYSVLLAAEIIYTSFNIIFILMGLMFVVLGNYLPKFPSSYFIGIRTPWTLSSEIVWRKTHKLAGLSFIFAGILMIIIPMLFGKNSNAISLLMIVFFLLVFLPVIYSFILYKKVS